MKSILKLYHVVFYPNSETMYLNSYNIEAKDMQSALNIHYKNYPGIEPLYCVNKGDVINEKSKSISMNKSTVMGLIQVDQLNHN